MRCRSERDDDPWILRSIRMKCLQARGHRGVGAAPARDLGGDGEEQGGAVHARDAAGRRDGAGPRGAGAPGVRAGVHGRGHAGRGGRGADRPHPAGPLPDGARPAAALLHRGDHRRARQPARHHRGRLRHRPERWGDLDVLLAYAGEDPRHPPRRAGARGAPPAACSGNAADGGGVRLPSPGPRP